MPNTRSAFASHRWATEALAARPASLASSARTELLEAVALQASARAARPLASGALPEVLAGGVCRKSLVFRETGLSEFCGSRSAASSAFAGRGGGRKNPGFSKARLYVIKTQALRRSAKPNTKGRAATSFARGGGFGLLASGATQRKMRAGRVLFGARSNPSIEGTSNGGPRLHSFAGAVPPLLAPHLKR
jgi:hypothetical protein